MPEFNPGFLIVLAALLIPLLPQKPRRLYMALLPLLSFLWLRQFEVGDYGSIQILGEYTLTTFRVDRLSLVFAYVFHLALFLGTLYSLHLKDTVQQVSAVIYGGGTIAGVLAGDWFTLFVCWELVAVASTFLIWARRTPRAYRAGQRYLIFQITSGLFLLAGILFHLNRGGDMLIGPLGKLSLSDPAGVLIMLAFGIKSAFPGLHVWLSDAYPEATPTGAVFLSAFTSKLAVYALARCFLGETLLIYVGVTMAAFPIFYAVIENDLRRVLAYSLINQVGFMVVGVGIGGTYGLNGAAAHAFADVIFKGLLFMSMGAVLHRTGRINGSDLGGLRKTMPFTTICCIVGAASISAFPLFSAFATKSLIMNAAAIEHRSVVWLVLLFAAAGVFHHAGIKIPFFAFFAHDSGLRPKPAPWNMRVAMGASAAGCILIGCFPYQLYALLPDLTMLTDPAKQVVVYTPAHVITQLQLLFFSALAFASLMLTGLYPPELHSVNLDADWLLRRGGKRVWRGSLEVLKPLAAGFQSVVLEVAPREIATWVVGDSPLRKAARRRWLASSLFVVMILLFVYLVRGFGAEA
jgi:multicomponent Na+:H+ antiporter subunit D